MIGENPAKDATAPTPSKSRVKAFTADQVTQLLAAAERDVETYAITALFLACGLRRSEVLGLAWDCVDFDRGTIEIRRTVVQVDHKPVMREQAKTDSSMRTVAIPEALADLLREQKARVQALALKWGKGYQRDPLLVFPSLAGAPMMPMSLTLRMRQVMRRAVVVGPSPCHAWRHTSATALLHAGQNLKTVQSTARPLDAGDHDGALRASGRRAGSRGGRSFRRHPQAVIEAGTYRFVPTACQLLLEKYPVR